MVSELGGFEESCVSVEDYEEEGPEICHKLNLLALS